MLFRHIPLDSIVDESTLEFPLDSRTAMILGAVVLAVVVITAIIYIMKRK